MVERDPLYAYQGLKDTTKGEESVEDHLPASITQGASNLHSDEDMEGKIKQLDPRVQKLIRTYLEVFGELPPPASCDKLVQMDLKLKPEFVGHKIRRRPYPASCLQDHQITPTSSSPISLDRDSTASMILKNSQSFEIVHPSLISEYPAIIHSNCTIKSQFLLIQNPELQHRARWRPKPKSACGGG